MRDRTCPMCNGTGANPQGFGECPAIGCVRGQLVETSGPSAVPRPGGGCIGWLFGNLLLGIIGLVLFGAVVAGAAAYRSLRSDRPGLLGEQASASTWEGTYVCGATKTRLRLDLEVAAGKADVQRRVDATLTYLDAPPATSTATGTLTDRSLALIGQDPTGAPGFQVRALRATIAEDARQLLGGVESPDCQSVGLHVTD